MSFKKCQVLLLPTNEKAIGCLVKGFKTLQYHPSQFFTQEYLKLHNHNSEHLYIVSDDKIEKNDWYIGDFKEIKQATNFTIPYIKNCDNFKKIIATTDQSLLIPAYTISNIPLPQPSQQFIEKYIEEYNEGNVITEVMVEYETKLEWCYSHSGNRIQEKSEPSLKVNSKDNTITIRRTKDSWNRNELAEILNLWSIECGITDAKETINNWIKDNL